MEKATADHLSIIPSVSRVPTGRLVHVAMPVRWSLVGQDGRGAQEIACTYDIHPNGARLLSSRSVRAGDLLMMERGRNKAVCRVMWSADAESPLRGQFTVQCVEGRAPWEDELRQQVEEQFHPVVVDAADLRRRSAVIRTDVNRRRRPRFYVEGHAEVIDGMECLAGEVQQISEYGARISAAGTLQPGADFRLRLNVFDVSLALKAQVKYLVSNLGMGVEFHEIRRGDRPLLSYVLGKVRSRRVEEFAEVEVVTEALVAAG